MRKEKSVMKMLRPRDKQKTGRRKKKGCFPKQSDYSMWAKRGCKKKKEKRKTVYNCGLG
jgi:hypothetical protein